jgi:hypothetical protein
VLADSGEATLADEYFSFIVTAGGATSESLARRRRATGDKVGESCFTKAEGRKQPGLAGGRIASGGLELQGIGSGRYIYGVCALSAGSWQRSGAWPSELGGPPLKLPRVDYCWARRCYGQQQNRNALARV